MTNTIVVEQSIAPAHPNTIRAMIALAHEIDMIKVLVAAMAIAIRGEVVDATIVEATEAIGGSNQ